MQFNHIFGPCEVCRKSHWSDYAGCTGMLKFAQIVIDDKPRIPDNDLSVCTLNPGRAQIADRLLESIPSLSTLLGALNDAPGA
jgi:hypothetical protein